MRNTVWRAFHLYNPSHLGHARGTLILAIALTLAGLTGCANGGGGNFSGGGGGSTTPDYSLSTSPASLAVMQGASGNSTITIVPANGFTGTVNLAASGLPTGVTASFSSTSATSSSTLTLTASGTATTGTTNVTITGTSGSLSHTTAVSLTVSAAPVLSTSVQTQGNFAPNQQNAQYSIVVSNAAGSGATSGTITVTDPPINFKLVSALGNGWTCVLDTPSGGFTCTRSDSLPGGGSFPPIIARGNVTATAGQSVTIPASASGGGTTAPGSTTGSVPVAVPVLSISKTHTGNFVLGQQGAIYTITVANAASGTPAVGPTDGATPVTVVDDLTSAPGLTFVSMSSTDPSWICTAVTKSCTRSDSLPAGQSYPLITVRVNVAVNAAPSQTNKASLTSSGGSATLPTASDVTAIAAPPTISKAFGAGSIALNASTSLTFTISNPAANTVALSGVAFADALPTGLVVATPNGLANACGGTPNAVAGSDTVSLSAASLAVNSSCTLAVNVTGTTAGTKPNVTFNVTATNGGTGNTGSANLTVVAPPTFTETFGGATVAVNASTPTSLTFNLSNPNTGTTLNGVGFTDILPAGLVISTPNGLSNTCGGTATATAGSGSLTLTGVTLAANAACSVAANVTGTTAGVKNNTTGNITSTEGGSGTTATASVTVVAPPAISKAFSPTAINQNASTTVTFTIINPAANTVALNGVAFSDTLAGGLVVATPNGLNNSCGAGSTVTATAGTTSISLSGGTVAVNGSCTVKVDVKGGSTGVNLPNTTGTISSTEGGTGATSNTANVSVAVPPTISKAFGAASIPLNGTTSMTFTVTNLVGNAFALSGLAFTDSLPAGLVVATPNGLSNTCTGTATATAASSSVSFSGGTVAAKSSCTVVVNVQGTSAGIKTNTTGVIFSTESGAGATSNTASLTVEAPPQVTDSFSPLTILLNGSTTLTVTITNPAANPAVLSGVAFTDTLPAGLVIAASPALTNTCGGTPTAASGSGSLSLSGGSVGLNTFCTISVSVTANSAGALSNAGFAASATNGGTGNPSNTANLTVVAPPQFTKNFSAANVAVGAATTLTFSITNPNVGTPLSGIGFADNFPTGLTLTGTPLVSNTCSVAPTAVANGSIVSLSAATLAASASCSIVVNVTPTTGGVKNNLTNNITSNEGGAGPTASASLTAIGPPQFTKAFGAASIALNNATTLTFNITNPNAGNSLSGIGFIDNLPTGLTLTGTPLASNTCSVAPTAAANGTSVTLSGALLGTSASCTIVVNVTGTSAGVKNNTTTAITSTEAGNGPTANASVTVVAPPQFTKSFGVPSIGINSSTTLTFSISNPNATTALSGIAFTDSLPLGLTVATPNGLTGSCPIGTITAGAGSGSVSLSGLTLAAGASCNFTVNVASNTNSGAKNNTTSTISSNEGGSGAAASASLNVVIAPTITKAFGPTAIALNANSTVTFTITNPSANAIGLTGISFSDTLPSGLVVGTAPGVGGTCNGTPTAVAGTGTISLAAATLAANTSCTLTVNVKATSAGTLLNTTGAISSVESGAGAASNTASLTVSAPPTISKAFGPGSVALNASTSLTFTITNPVANTGPLNGIAFTDALPVGLVVATPSGLASTCGGTATAVAGSGAVSLTGGTVATNSSCTVAVNVKATSAGTLANTTGTISSTEGGTGATSNTANLNVVAPPQFTKAFGTQNLVLNSSTSLTFTVTNPNATAGLTGIAFTDTLPPGLTVSSPNGLTGSCPSGVITAVTASGSVSLSGATLGAALSCNFAVNVTGNSLGSLTNTTSVIASNEGGNGTAATANLTVVTIAPPTFTKSFGVTSFPINGSTTLTFNISNPNSAVSGFSLSGIGFTDTLPAGLVVSTPNGLTGTCGGGTITAGAGSGSVSLATATLAANTSCSFTVSVKGTTATTKLNTTTNITSTEAGNGGTATASVTVVGPPLLSKNFGLASIPVNSSTTLTFTLSNPNPVSLTGVGFTDTFPANLVLTSLSPVVSNTCTGALTAVAGAGSVSLSGATLAFGPPCSIVVNVTSSVAGTANNTTSTISSNEGGSGATANASLNVTLLPPTISKAFGATGVSIGGTTSLTFTLTNPAANNVALTGVAFTDTFPTSPGNMVVATPLVTGGTCVGGTFTAVAGAGSVSLSGLTLATNSSCTLSVNVTAPGAGTYNNTTGTVSSTNGGTGTTSNTATLNARTPPNFTKAFGLSSIPLNGTTTLTFTITNAVAPVPLTNISFNDTFPAGLLVATPNGLANNCSAGGGLVTATAGTGSVSLTSLTLANGASCTVIVNVTGTTTGTKNNVSNAITSVESGPGVTASASLTVGLTSDLSITKTDGVTSITTNTPTTYTVRVTNNGPDSATGAILTDAVASGLSKTGVVCSGAGLNQCVTPPTISQLEGGTFPLPTLANTQFYEIMVTANVTATSGTVTNIATVTAPTGTTDPSTVNNIFSDIDTVVPPSGSFSISGNITGGSGGRIFIRVYPNNCTGCDAVAGTSVAAPGPYTVNGLLPVGGGGNGNGSYIVNAETDLLNTGIMNASNPAGSSSVQTVSSANVTGANITVNSRTPLPVTPDVTQLSVSPSDAAALVQYDTPTSGGEEIATSYKLYYTADPAFLTGVSSKTFPAQGTDLNLYLLTGLSNGPTYFKISAFVNGTESALSSMIGPVTIGAPLGNNTISGAVQLPASATAGAPLYVGVYSQTGGVYFTRINNPTFPTPQSYSFAGVPSGTYFNFAIVDNNNNGLVDVGDFTNVTQNNLPPITVSANVSNANVDLTGTDAVATTLVVTEHSRFLPGPDWYNLNLGVNWGTKRPVIVTLTAGPNVSVPWDLGADNHSQFTPQFATAPIVGQAYTFHVTYSDLTTQDIIGTVSGVLNSFPQNLAMNTPVAGSNTIPMLNWAAPASPPATYTYDVGVFSQNFNLNWNYSGGQDSNGIPSTTTNVLYNVDSQCSPKPGCANLTPGTTYNWNVRVRDTAKSNSATIFSTYTPVGGVTVSSLLLSPNPVIGPTSVTATVILSAPAPTGGAIVTLGNTNTAVTTGVPPNIFINQGAVFTTFTFATLSVGAQATTDISATFGGVTQTTTLTDVPTGAFLLSNMTLNGGNAIVGGDTATQDTVTLSKTSGTATVVNLTSSNPSLATVPATVTVTAGQTTSAQFSITTSLVGTATPVTISATFTNGGTVSRTVNINPPLTITTTALPLGGKSVAYPTTTIAINGGVGNKSYSVSAGTPPTGITLVNTAPGTGTNQGQLTTSGGSITGNAGVSTFTVQVTDTPGGGLTAHTAIKVLSIQVDDPATTNPCLASGLNGSESKLNGPYAFFLQGFKGIAASTGTPVAMAGSFVANGTGGITGGAEDLSDTSGHQLLTVSSDPSAYTVGPDGRGCITLTYTGGTTTKATFHFVLGGVGANGTTAPTASTGRILEFDDYAGTGTHVSGVLRRQDTTAYASGNTSALAPRYALGIDGVTAGNSHFAIAGSINLNTGTGAITSGVFDSDAGSTSTGAPGTLVTNGLFTSGSFGNPNTGTGRLVFNSTSAIGTFNFANYVVNANESFMVMIDPFSTVQVVESGRAIATASSYTSSSISGSYILHSTAINSNQNNGNTICTPTFVAGPPTTSPCADATVGIVTFTPTTTTTGNLGGSTTFVESGFSSTNGIGGTYAVDTATGRVTFPNGGTIVLYIVTPVALGSGATEPISAFTVGAGSPGDPTAVFGLGEAQPSGSYSIGSLSGNFILAAEDIGQNNVGFNNIGQGTYSGGTFTINRDASTTGGLLVNVPNTFSFTINADGTASGTNGLNTVGVTNGKKLFWISIGGAAGVRVFEQQ